MKMKRFLAAAALAAIAASPAQAVVVVASDGLIVDPANATDTVTTNSPFDIGNASKLVVAVSAEGNSSEPEVESLLFGTQPLTRAAVVGDVFPQRTEIWYLDRPFADVADFTVNWSGNVNGTGFGIVSLNNVELGDPVATAAATESLSVSITIPQDTDGPIDNSFVFSSFVSQGVNGSDGAIDPAGSPPTFTELYGGDVGSAEGAAGFDLVSNPGAGGLTETYSYLGSATRPVSIAAVWETGDFFNVRVRTPGDTDEDNDVDLMDFTTIASNLGRSVAMDVGPDVADGNGFVDFRDLRLWQANFPTSAPGGVVVAAVTTPEPTAALLLVAPAACLAARRTRRA